MQNVHLIVTAACKTLHSLLLPQQSEQEYSFCWPKVKQLKCLKGSPGNVENYLSMIRHVEHQAGPRQVFLKLLSEAYT